MSNINPFGFRPVFSQMIGISRFSDSKVDCGHTGSGDFSKGNTCGSLKGSDSGATKPQRKRDEKYNMYEQILKPETLKNLKEIRPGEQYNKFVRVNKSDANYIFKQNYTGQKITVMIKDRLFFVENENDLTKGKLFNFFI
jgi:hypothetical protein